MKELSMGSATPILPHTENRHFCFCPCLNVHKSVAAAVSCSSTEGADGPSWHSRSRQKYATLTAEYEDEHTAEFCSLYVEIFVFGAV